MSDNDICEMESGPFHVHLGATSILRVYLNEPSTARTLDAILGSSSIASSNTKLLGDPLRRLDDKFFSTIPAPLAFLPVLAKVISRPSTERCGDLEVMAQKLADRLSCSVSGPLRAQENGRRPAVDDDSVTSNTKQPLRLSEIASYDELVSTCTGLNQRWEPVGILFTIAGKLLMCTTSSTAGTIFSGLAFQGRDAVVKTTPV